MRHWQGTRDFGSGSVVINGTIASAQLNADAKRHCWLLLVAGQLQITLQQLELIINDENEAEMLAMLKASGFGVREIQEPTPI